MSEVEVSERHGSRRRLPGRRNVLDGRWTFQVVDEFDDLYYRFVVDAMRRLERDHLAGHRHVYESRMKDDRQRRGRPGQERRPPAAWSADVPLDENS